MGTVRHRWSYKGIGGTKSFYARVRGIKVWRRFDVTVPQKKKIHPPQTEEISVADCWGGAAIEAMQVIGEKY